MDAGGDRYNQHVEVRFEGPRRAAPTAERRSRPHWLRRGFTALPSFLASLRKVMFDLTAIALPIGVGIFFVSILTDETIVIEVPAVPQAVQDRGITPDAAGAGTGDPRRREKSRILGYRRPSTGVAERGGR